MEEIIEEFIPNIEWPDAVEQFGHAFQALTQAYADELRRRRAPKPDRLADFIATMDNVPQVLPDITARGIVAGFSKTEVREYITRAVADGTIHKSRKRPISYWR